MVVLQERLGNLVWLCAQVEEENIDFSEQLA